MRWADTTRISHGIPSCSSAIDACSRHGKSERLPPTMPTSGPDAVVHSGLPAQRRAGRAARSRARRRRPSRSPSRGPSCAARTRAACRRGGRGRRGRRAASGTPVSRAASRSGPVPSRLTIAASPVRPHGSQRQPEDRAQLLLELRGHGALDRPVAGVVHPRRELVDHQPAAPELEQLDRQQPDEVEAADEAVRDLARVERPPAGGSARARRSRRGSRRRGRCARLGTRASGPRGRARTRPTAPPRTRSRAPAAAARPSPPPSDRDRPRDVARTFDPDLAPAVVAADGSLEAQGVAEGVRGGAGVIDAPHLAPWRRALADLADERAARRAGRGSPAARPAPAAAARPRRPPPPPRARRAPARR